MSTVQNKLILQWWAVDESRMMGFELNFATTKYNPVIQFTCFYIPTCAGAVSSCLVSII